MNFETAMEFTRNVSSNAIYQEPELSLLWSALVSLKKGSDIVEVGCEYGRSTSLMAQVARDRNYCLTCIDPFLTYDGAAAPEFMKMMMSLKIEFKLIKGETRWACDAGLLKGEQWHLVHIDGDHTEEGVVTDCRCILSRLREGGLAVFHDYGRKSLPEVKEVVDAYTEGWELFGSEESCYAVRKPKEVSDG